MLHRSRFHVTNIACVVAVHLVVLFAACHKLLCGVNDHTVVTMLPSFVCNIVWLVFASQEVGTHAGDST